MLTYNTRRMRFSKDRSEAKITNFDLTLIPIDENVVTFKVSMNDRGIVTVQIHEALQYLSAPMFYCSNVDPLMSQPKPNFQNQLDKLLTQINKNVVN